MVSTDIPTSLFGFAWTLPYVNLHIVDLNISEH